uniref:CUE domain-containing protein n=1 Tax=Panagrellus redivivus TaxID=6233 RepID=A0A7E5A1F7_PANRE
MDQAQRFDEALEQFKSMFPSLAEGDIEAVIRRKNGNNEEVLDELLALASKPCTSRSQTLSGASSDFFFLDPPPPYSAVVDKDNRSQQQAAASVSESSRRASNASNETIDDEKIALLIQNEEFLNYLRRNKNFMRELYGTECTRHPSRYRNQSPPRNIYGGSVSSRYSSRYDYNDYAPNMSVPNGPVFEQAASSIPNGPVVDFNYNDNSIWPKRLKAKISGKSQNAYAIMPVETTPPYLEPYNPAMFSNFPSRLRAMSKSSREAFTSLARKFSSSKKTRMMPQIEAPSNIFSQEPQRN